MQYIKKLVEIRNNDVPLVGGKNASLGEMIGAMQEKNIRVPDGFAILAQAYWDYLEYNNLIHAIDNLLIDINAAINIVQLQEIGHTIRNLIKQGVIPSSIQEEIRQAYKNLGQTYHEYDLPVAVRSSATAEDLPGASFAGQHETFLYISGIENVFDAYKKSLASLFTDRAIMYRLKNDITFYKVAMSVGIQKMIRSDDASSGVIFTLDTESGFRDVVLIESSWGLGEAIVQGIVNPDEFCVYKGTYRKGFKPLVQKKLGEKNRKICLQAGKLINKETSFFERAHFSLSDDEIFQLVDTALIIEEHYTQLRGAWAGMDIEWAKDSVDGLLYIVQARPETVYGQKKIVNNLLYTIDNTFEKKILCQGQAVGCGIAAGRARIILSMTDAAVEQFNVGDILITGMTNPDWLPLMKKASGLVTELGGRTSHASIVSRELGLPALIGVSRALSIISNDQDITIDCSQGSRGYVYQGLAPIEKKEINIASLPKPSTKIFINCGDPERAFRLSYFPVDGVGLARTEFIMSNYVKIHPMAAVALDAVQDQATRKQIEQLVQAYPDARNYVINVLAQAIGTIAAAFYPRPVLVRFSDFKTNEYRNLIGGTFFEPLEENPMLGLRGASRYYSKLYEEAFLLECKAIEVVRHMMGFDNVHLMIPFVRTIKEAEKVLSILSDNGLQKKHGLKIYMMCEIPSNVILIEEFSQFFDGFSIGSNDLTQLILAVDRDSNLLAGLFDERDQAVQVMVKVAMQRAHACNKEIGICGQAPSDYPDLARWLIAQGIDSISLNADSVIPFLQKLAHSSVGE